jgi:predicted dehydrogenase/NADPH:quinone reductase-like Zn-dependent oxidoreductase
MKFIQQNLKSGETSVQQAPIPGSGTGRLTIRTQATLISAGTEKMLVEFGKASLLGKARAQPDKVKQVLDKLRSDGVLPTMETVFNRLDEPLPLGYCNAGIVLDVGPGVKGFRPGDRVASNGPHAEIVSVPANLCAKIPDSVTKEQAAFTVLSSIGLQGIRLVQPTLGERVVVYGLGLIGLVTVQLLLANGCEVLGIDLNPQRCKLAAAYGAKVVEPGGDPVAAASAWTEGKGVDAVLITASAKTDDIVHHAALMCRKRGRIVLVGVVGLNLRRADFYEKELTFQVSCSYGPGRYDESYELAGRDYPFGFVRWTEQRNFEAILQLLASKRLVVDDLITHRYPLEQAPTAYEKLSSDGTALGVILEYPKEPTCQTVLHVSPRKASPTSSTPALAVIGAGNFSKMTLMPALEKASARLRYVCDHIGSAATHLARKHHAEMASSNHEEVLADAQVDAVLIAVGHNAHARLVKESLAAGKHVFVEKPLALDAKEVREILDAAEARPDLHVMVGFNRRFSPHIVKAKQLLSGRSEPLAMTMTINAGIIPAYHWVHDPERGGGRIIGEACHFIDLLAFLVGSPVQAVSAFMVGSGPAVRDDKVAMSLLFSDGSVGNLSYFANGSKAYPKEQLEIFSDGRVLRLNNFQSLEGHGFKGFSRFKTLRQEKGHAAEVAAFIERLSTGGAPLIPLEESVNTTLASFAALQSAQEQRVVPIAEWMEKLNRP